MEPELTALAASGATTLVTLMATDAWTQVRDRVARLLRRPTAADDLETYRGELEAARRDGDTEAAGDVEAQWRRELRRVLAEDPAAAAELRAILAEAEAAQGGAQGEGGGRVTNVVSGGRQGTVIQGRDFHIDGGLHLG
ncbi:hypothetical protein [Streptomyces sp. CA-111067]|uniref:hypothetical protein n=1 Tax=Streptomyces sp. CA-111067 TaxID=3240046 RepID=UPI003D99A2F5